MNYLLGLDIGSSSVKAALLDAASGTCAEVLYPKTEQSIEAPQPGFAEQDPANWYASAKSAIRDAMYEAGQPQKMLKR